MKLRYISIILAACALCSCKDALDLKPLDSFTDVSYWSTVNDLKLYANGLYTLLPGPSASLDNESDDMVTTNYSSYLFNETSVPASGGNWSFTNIRNCNFFLARYQTVEGNEADINHYVAEVRFFRSLQYFDMVKRFGDVPWYERDLTTEDTDELYKGRDNKYMVVGKIIEDLEFAINWLPEKGNTETGRLHKDAARLQLARVCLHFGTYMKYHNESGDGFVNSTDLITKAKSLTDELINSGRYEIVRGSDAEAGQAPYEGYPLYYSNLFTSLDFTNNKECILPRIYETGTVTQNVSRETREADRGLSRAFAESFLMKNGLPIYNEGSGYKGDEDLYDEYEGRDPRMYQIIDNIHKPYYVSNGVPTQDALERIVNPRYGLTGYRCLKFHHADMNQDNTRLCTMDWFIYRYAEALLINAEANEELGTCTQEVLDNTINKLRDRVDMAHLTVNPVADAKPYDYGYKMSNLLYEIRRERRIELAAEGFRMDDLKRWNAMKLLEDPKTMFGIRVTDAVIARFPEGTFNGATGRPVVEYEGKGYLFQYAAAKAVNEPSRVWAENDRRWYYPIPTQELTLNPNLKQNPGW